MLRLHTLHTPAFILCLLIAFTASAQQALKPYQDTHLSADERVNDLLKQLTLEEKIQLLGFNSKGVPRLGIPVYNWWNEALHGVARAGEATVFPQAVALAATFNDELQQNIADVISTEARAKYNLAIKLDRRIQYMGLTFWSPNINIFRDPRWGRGQETYGEDPYLTSRMGKAFVRGLQGNDPHYLKTSACAKHFAVHSGPEANRHTFNAIVDEKDLRETYLYAFHELVNAGVESVMCAYNRVNDEPCCTGNTLLHKILRDEWKFKGHVVTDCWALEDIWLRHKVMPDAIHVAAAAVKAGVNLDCSNMLQDDLLKAVEQKLITEKEIEQALIPSLRTQFKLGFYDDPSLVPYHSLGAESIHNTHNIEQARLAAQQSMVLLKNDKNILPLKANQYGSILVTGANAASLDALLGNYHGVSSNTVTFVEGITKAAGPATVVQYDLGCNDVDSVHFGGLWASENSDVTIAVLGLTPVSEGEEGDAFLAAHGGDKADLSIPASHLVFLKALRKKHHKPIIAVITAGSAIDIHAIAPYADAVVLAWYSGEQGGNALADILFGKVSPSGRLPVTFYNSFSDLPAYDSYAVKGRTYRYFTGKVQYPFGFGLSYTQFAYEWKQKPKDIYKPKDILSFTATIKNTGAMEGDEVVQAYIKYPTGERVPLKELKQFKRVHVAAGSNGEVALTIPLEDLQKWNLKTSAWEVTPGKYTLVLGGNSQDEKLVHVFTVKK
ncbi:MAG TPA: glycoside hydrolase family 3 N-terminal domain-containing protein [Ohtaekwangia sp.]|uniref:glycoside hydrolase family 3 N-terminal domain-containing protein n=1 Tax=Ohtaekwangia sp. TaxID=2066019 RepID=UPI002F93DBC5